MSHTETLTCNIEGCDRPSARPADYEPLCSKHYLHSVKEAQDEARRHGEERAAKLLASRPECLHGCGVRTKGGRYLPGHDAKHVAWLLEEVRLGVTTADAAITQMPTPNMHNKMVRALRKLGYRWNSADRVWVHAPLEDKDKK